MVGLASIIQKSCANYIWKLILNACNFQQKLVWPFPGTNGRSRKIMVVQARFRLFHGISRSSFWKIGLSTYNAIPAAGSKQSRDKWAIEPSWNLLQVLLSIIRCSSEEKLNLGCYEPKGNGTNMCLMWLFFIAEKFVATLPNSAKHLKLQENSW